MADNYTLVFARDPVTGMDVMVDYVVQDSTNEAMQKEITRAYTDALGAGTCAWTQETSDPWKDINEEYEKGCKSTNLSHLTYFTIDDAFEEIALRAKDPTHAQLIADLNAKGQLTNPTEKQVRAAIEKAKARAAQK